MALLAEIIRYEGGSRLLVWGGAEGVVEIEIKDGVAYVTDNGVPVAISGMNTNVNSFDTNGLGTKKLVFSSSEVDTTFLSDRSSQLYDLDRVIYKGGGGNDDAYGSLGNDSMRGGTGDDILRGISGDDNIKAGAGDDLLWGGYGNDTLVGGGGIDSLFDGVNFDEASTGDHYDGGSGRDSVDYYGAWDGIALDLSSGQGSQGAAAGDTYVNIENVYATLHDDVVIGNEVGNAVQGLGGNDALYGLNGKDELIGGFGSDIIDGGAGNDYLEGFFDGSTDTYMFNFLNWGKDRIGGWEDGIDKIDLTGTGLAFSDLEIHDDGVNTYIRVSTEAGGTDERITLLGIQDSSIIGIDDFLWA